MKRAPKCEKFLALFRDLESETGIPAAFWEALAQRESSCNPLNDKGPAWGLFQIVESVRKSWNERFPNRAVTRQQLLEPEINANLAAFTWRNILTVLSAVGEPPKWDDPRWVELAVAAWNAGYSHKRGMGRAIKWLRERGHDITAANAVKYAKEIGLVYQRSSDGATRGEWWLAPQRPKWWRSVVERYFALRGLPKPDLPKAPTERGNAAFLVLSLLGLGGSALAWHLLKRR